MSDDFLYGEPECFAVDGTPMAFIRVYEMDRAYGGPEEGGWYYNCGVAVSPNYCVKYTEEDVEDAIYHLRKIHEDENAVSISSVSYNGGCYGARASSQPLSENFPTFTPHYE